MKESYQKKEEKIKRKEISLSFSIYIISDTSDFFKLYKRGKVADVWSAFCYGSLLIPKWDTNSLIYQRKEGRVTLPS